VNNSTVDSEPATTTVDVFPALSPDVVVVTPFCAAPGAEVRVSASSRRSRSCSAAGT